MKFIERLFEGALWRSRYIVLFAVVASMAASFAIFFLATADVVYLLQHVSHYLDPGLTQHWIHAGQLRLAPPDAWVTIGEGVADGAARVPDCGLRWIHTSPPVALDAWPSAPPPGEDLARREPEPEHELRRDRRLADLASDTVGAEILAVHLLLSTAASTASTSRVAATS